MLHRLPDSFLHPGCVTQLFLESCLPAQGEWGSGKSTDSCLWRFDNPPEEDNEKVIAETSLVHNTQHFQIHHPFSDENFQLLKRKQEGSLNAEFVEQNIVTKGSRKGTKPSISSTIFPPFSSRATRCPTRRRRTRAVANREARRAHSLLNSQWVTN